MTPDDEPSSPPPEPPSPAPDDRRRAAGGKRSQWFFRIDPTPEERQRFLEQLAIYLAAMYPGCGRDRRRKLIRKAREKGHYGRLSEVATRSLRATSGTP